jgi:hypothetical protein
MVVRFAEVVSSLGGSTSNAEEAAMQMHWGSRSLYRRIILLAAAVQLLMASQLFAAGTATVALPLFPAEVFHRSTSAPATVVRSFSVPDTRGSFTLHVQNGDGATDNLVSAAVIKVNGVMVVRPPISANGSVLWIAP